MKKYIFIIFLINVFCISCKKESGAMPHDILSVCMNNPDSALQLLKDIDGSLLSEEERARHALFYYMAIDKTYGDRENDSLISIAYNFYKDRPQDTLYAKCMYYMGMWYTFFTDSVQLGESCLNKSIDAAQKTGDNNTEYLASHVLARSVGHSNPSRGIELAKRELAITEQYDSANINHHAYALLNLSAVQIYAGYYDESISNLRRALKDAQELNDSIILSNVYQELALNYFDLNRADSAVYYARKSIETRGQSNLTQLNMYSAALLLADSLDECKDILHMILKSSPNVESQCIAYRHLQKIAIKEGNKALALEYADSINSTSDEVYKGALRLKDEYYQEVLQKEKETTHLIAEKRVRSLTFMACMVISFIIVAILLYIIYSRRKVAKLKMRLLSEKHEYEIKLQQEKSQHEIEKRELQLSMMRDHLLKQFDIIRKIESRRETDTPLSIDENEWDSIEVFLNSIDNLFVVRFRTAFPTLSDKDIRFCMLLRLGVSNKDLVNIYCINERSVKQKKYLFKAKLGLQDAEISLNQYIKAF